MKFILKIIESKLLSKTSIFFAIAIISIQIFISSCANMAAPSGGPKDETPPEIVSIEPANYSTNFNKQNIEITFDEYIQLKSIDKQLIISPPFDEKPEIKIKGKTLYIDLNNKLIDSTTYTLNFGNSIVDNNEGNVYENFMYVFATGDEIDSLSVKGNIKDAFSMKAAENVYVMLYANLYDSVPYKELPLYVARTSKTGDFVFNNIRKDTFLIFALKDANQNFLFDQPTEAIAFLDSFIIPQANIIQVIDTIKIAIDTIKTKNDSLNIADSLISSDSLETVIYRDSIITKNQTELLPDNIELFLFEEYVKRQYLVNTQRTKPGKCEFFFYVPLKDSLSIVPLNFEEYENYFLYEKNATNDSITLWLSDTNISKQDTLSFSIRYLKEDSTNTQILFTDTVDFKYREIKKDYDFVNSLKIKLNIKNNRLINLNKQLLLECSNPIKNIDSSQIILSHIVDSVEIRDKFQLLRDTTNFRTYTILKKWAENTDYKLFINQNTFTDIFGFSNDSIELNFSTQKLEYYGNIILNLSAVDTNSIIQLLSADDKILRQFNIVSEKTIEIKYLQPVEYKFKAIIDENRNKKWDTGNYLKKIHPEKVILYPQTTKIRSNWDFELNWELKKE